jgi:hypothetical protein
MGLWLYFADPSQAAIEGTTKESKNDARISANAAAAGVKTGVCTRFGIDDLAFPVCVSE